MGKWKKLKRANLENSVNVQKQPPKIHSEKTLFFNWMKWGKI